MVDDLAPKAGNKEADPLANGEHFDPALEVKVKPYEIEWDILDEVLVMGQEAEDDARAARDHGALPRSVLSVQD